MKKSIEVIDAFFPDLCRVRAAAEAVLPSGDGPAIAWLRGQTAPIGPADDAAVAALSRASAELSGWSDGRMLVCASAEPADYVAEPSVLQEAPWAALVWLTAPPAEAHRAGVAFYVTDLSTGEVAESMFVSAATNRLVLFRSGTIFGVTLGSSPDPLNPVVVALLLATTNCPGGD